MNLTKTETGLQPPQLRSNTSRVTSLSKTRDSSRKISV